ncbi:hypothetical protein AWC38_SpisGene4745 [Stylophora pistillata]|uniref:Reverse transcriptase domain-containing protein n=1 Tax=Stylophora pistillata TaxID=50429 RepID=A0A2B4SPN3_STYPI|nr:hypothetical protein AWC38_SpisGene4745 [Stylophora pistillata]
MPAGFRRKRTRKALGEQGTNNVRSCSRGFAFVRCTNTTPPKWSEAGDRSTMFPSEIKHVDNGISVIDANQKIDKSIICQLGKNALGQAYEVLPSIASKRERGILDGFIPLDETIESIAERAFENDWFNREYDLNITKSDLMELVRIATKNQQFQVEGKLYEQVDGVDMGSPLGPLMANAFVCRIEKQLERENKMPIFYKRFVDDTLSVMPDPEAASEFLETLNKSHPSIDFTMELQENGSLPLLGMDVIRNGCRLDTMVYRKPTEKGLLLHYHSHVDARYKRSLLITMLNRAFQLSSTWTFFHEECERLKEIFSRLPYPDDLVQSTIRRFVQSKVSGDSHTRMADKREVPVRIVLPYKVQKSANVVRKQLADLSRKINVDISPVYTSKKIKSEIRVREDKPPLVSQQCVVYSL